MYVTGNPKTKTALKKLIVEGRRPEVFAPGLGTPIRNGVETVCGPHSPAAHSWYARVKVENGIVTKILA